MSATTYNFTISTDFQHGVATDRLQAEIAASAIVTALDHIDTAGDTCGVVFKAALSEEDEARLAGLVDAHSGEPLPVSAAPVTIQGAKLTNDGRLTIRHTIALTGEHHVWCFSFYTSDPSKLFNTKCDGTPLDGAHMHLFDANGDEITEAPYDGAVMTVVDFEPAFDYEIIGGLIYAPTDLKDGTTDQWFAGCIGLPEVPQEYGGQFMFVNSLNLEAFPGVLEIDGRATALMRYTPGAHTNEMGFVIRHPPGASKRFQVMLRLFY